MIKSPLSTVKVPYAKISSSVYRTVHTAKLARPRPAPAPAPKVNSFSAMQCIHGIEHDTIPQK